MFITLPIAILSIITSAVQAAPIPTSSNLSNLSGVAANLEQRVPIVEKRESQALIDILARSIASLATPTHQETKRKLVRAKRDPLLLPVWQVEQPSKRSQPINPKTALLQQARQDLAPVKVKRDIVNPKTALYKAVQVPQVQIKAAVLGEQEQRVPVAPVRVAKTIAPQVQVKAVVSKPVNPKTAMVLESRKQ